MHNRKILGIDISNGRISAVLLCQTNNGIEALKSAAAPIPEGAMADGCVKNSALLAKAIKELCSRNKIPTSHTVVSLAVKPAILRIMEMPRDLSTNPAQYIRDELKHAAVMSGKTIMHDYCPLSSPKKSNATRLLLAATDEEKVTEFVKSFNRAGITIKAVEPGELAYIRLIHANAIAKKFNSNILIAVVRDTTTALCVFRDTNLDFVNTVETGAQNLDNEADMQNLLAEIDAITQFYDIEVADAPKQWDIILAFSGAHARQDHLRQSIQNSLAGSKVQISSPDTVRHDSQLTAGNDIGAISPTSAGLAMKYFKTGMADVKINLLPAGANEIHNMQKFALMAANIVIVVFLLSLLAVPLLQIKLKGINRTIQDYKQKQPSENTRKLLCTAASLDQQSKSLTEKIQAIGKIADSGVPSPDWPKILHDISRRIPREARITSLATKDTTDLFLTGQALSYDHVHVFVKRLEASPFIASAKLTKSEIDAQTPGILSYNIHCLLIHDKGSQPHAD